MPRILRVVRLLCAAVFVAMTGVGLADAAPVQVVAWTLVGSGVGYVFAALLAWRAKLKA